MDILEFIPTGRENAITRRELVGRVNLSDREVRKLIASARKSFPILNLQTGEGYYLPTKEIEVREFLNQEMLRAKSILEGLEGCRNWLTK